MPHTTHAYPFEGKVAQFARELSRRFTAGPPPRSFLLVLHPARHVGFLRLWQTGPGRHERAPHLLYDPLDDGVEYVWLSWQGIERPVMERLIGQRFEEADFLPEAAFAGRAGKLPREKEFPASWGVMF